MNVCAACGINAPKPDLPCAACGGKGSIEAPAPTRELFCVGVRCQFQCRGCGRLAPLDDVDLDGLVRCALCGLTQAWDASAWRDALAQAHALGDLAGGEGLHAHPTWALANNPFHDVGRTRATFLTTFTGTAREGGLDVHRSLRMMAGPGHPLCDRCHTPVEITLPGEGRASTRCPRCAQTRGYALTAGVLRVAEGLRAVLADGHRDEVKEARTTDAGAVGLACPGCGAPLPVAGHARTVACSFCHLVSRIPGEFAVGAAEAPPTPFWLVYSGPSLARGHLENPSGDDAVPIRPAPVGTVTRAGFLLRLIPSVVIAGGVTAVVGVALFLLMRAGFIRL